MIALRDRYPVVIVGGGPVGLALANELGWRGIDYLLVEQGTGAVTFPAGENIFSRTMEHLRRWGIADGVRYTDAFPVEAPRTLGFATTFQGSMLAVFQGTSNADGPRSDPHSPEGPLFCPKRAFDPALLAGARRHAVGTIAYGVGLAGFSQTDDEATVELVQESGARTTVRCDFLVGCDGARSLVRKGLGVRYVGQFGEGANFAVFFRAPDLLARLRARFGQFFAQIHTINTPRRPYLTSVDGAADWRLSMYVEPGETPDPSAVIKEAIAADLAFEVLGAQPWSGHRVVAARYAVGRVFLAGDAAHLRWPKGGFGANTGYGDAVDLGWKIAAVLEGWGGDALLASYESERRPIAVRNTNEAANNRVLDAMIEPDPALEAADEAGRLARERMTHRLFALRLREFNTTGVQLGYRYRASPICVDDASLEPPDDAMLYRPSTYPGSRAPHAWITPGRSTLDLFGRGFVLLAFSGAQSGSLPEAARRRGVPFSTVALDDPAIAALYERQLVLVRPDGHVAWRGDEPPDDADAIIARVVGAGAPLAG